MKKLILVAAALCVLGGAAEAKQKVLFIDSYHEGYGWSDGITEGVKETLGNQVDLKVIRLDTKRNGSEDFKKKAALEAKAVIESYKPDVVIAADDNASKYLIVPYYKNSDLPFVFCGVNWDASGYGFPCKNVTGMVEVAPIDGLLAELGKCAKGTRLGIVGPDVLTAHKEVDNIVKTFNLDPKTYFAKDVEDWKKGFAQLQGQVDLMILLSDGGLYDEYSPDLMDWVTAHTKVPTGAAYDFMSKYALISFAKVSQEQGRWAAQAALDILNGKSPSSIPIAQNEEGLLIINYKILEAAKIDVPYETLRIAEEAVNYY